MKPEQQRTKIAEGCGRTEGEWFCPTCKVVVPPVEVTFETTHDTKMGGCGCYVGSRKLPDYLNDLNAMHEAEATGLQHGGNWCSYVDQLARVKNAGDWKIRHRRISFDPRYRRSTRRSIFENARTVGRLT